ncbi:carbohydrate kinase family protein [Fusibacillus kribbianus]|uniref:Carbohydrate kinase family protein n=1 Tax=Fusibacillus kribbianus TaxID=3044208 RepID=A0AAP4BD15_9FIRM|nr:carbohydrate kinase family protein [Ruminococcus sp. YH-rum2234]MDI9242808.1 carbohydrate kinase family protein [Ruminococcus sp. YH-rum2234]
MERKGIVVAGTLTLDVTPVFDSQKKAKSVDEVFVPGKVVHMDGIDIHPGGATSNTGLGLKVLGADVRIVGKIGKDEFGDIVYRYYDKFGAAEDLIIDEKTATSYSIALTPPGIDRIFLHDPCAGNTFRKEDIDPALYKTAQIFHYGYPPVSRMLYLNGGAECIAMLKEAKEAGIATSVDMCAVDPECESGKEDWKDIMRRMAPYVDFFEPSIEELMFYLDREKYNRLYEAAENGDMIGLLDMERDVRPLAEMLVEWGAGVVLVKCGYRGLYMAASDGERLRAIGGDLKLDEADWAGARVFERSYVPEKVLSGTGAGDTTIAAFLYAVTLGYSRSRCIQLAAATGASCVEAYDALGGLKSFEELEKKIDAGWAKQ